MNALLYEMHYLYGTLDLGLRLISGDRQSAKFVVQLRGNADYSHACHNNGKGQYSICFNLVDASISTLLHPLPRVYQTGMFYFKTWMAPRVDLGTAEGEGGTIVECVKDVILLTGCLEDMHQTQLDPVPIYNDNKSTITLATQYGGNSKRVRYMIPRIAWLMEKFNDGIYRLNYMNTNEMPADIGTKRKSGTPFKEGRARAMGWYQS